MKVSHGAKNAFDAATTAFDGANSTLFLLLGGLSCFRRLRTVVGTPEGTRARATDPGAKQIAPAAADTIGDTPTDHVTLAVLGLLAAGQRLTDLCAGAAAPAETASPAGTDLPDPRPKTPSRRRAPLRALLR